MRSLLAICFLMLYLSVLIRPASPFLAFSFNEAMIVAEMCVQRDQVRNCCKGSCVLKEMQQEQTENEEDGRSTVPMGEKEAPVILTGNTIHFLAADLHLYVRHYEFPPFPDLIHPIFHPPAA